MKSKAEREMKAREERRGGSDIQRKKTEVNTSGI